MRIAGRPLSPTLVFLLVLPFMGIPGLAARRLGATAEVAYAVFYASTLAVLVFGYLMVLSGNAGVNYWARSGAVEKVQRYLDHGREREDRANWRIPVSGVTPLHVGAAAGHVEVVRLLLSRQTKRDRNQAALLTSHAAACSLLPCP